MPNNRKLTDNDSQDLPSYLDAPSAPIADTQSKYKPFPTFAEWLSQPAIVVAIEAVRNIVSELKTRPDYIQSLALDRVRDIAALETGAIEDLYQANRGITVTAATSAALLDAVNQAHGEKVRAYVAAAIDAYHLVLDFSTKKQPIAAAWVRQLHASICRTQETYCAVVGDHYEDRVLPKGEYKELPNHVLEQDGNLHHHASPQETEPEVNRMIEEMRSAAFEAAHPIEQASYAHYALVVIHPFVDGNGRVARTLASLFTYRAYSLPLLIYAFQRDEYFRALSEADGGRFAPFKSFIVDSVMRAARILQQSFDTAALPHPLEALKAAARMYSTSGGYLQAEVDGKAIQLIGMLQGVLQERISNLANNVQLPAETRSSISLRSTVGGGDWAPTRPDHRRAIRQYGNRLVTLEGKSVPPADASANSSVAVSLPHDATAQDVFVLDTIPTGDKIEIPLGDFMNGLTLEAEILISLFADRLISRLVATLEKAGRQSLGSKGFT